MLIELDEYRLNREKKGNGQGIRSCCFSIAAGDVWSIDSDSTNDTHLLFKGLATLSYPCGGTYRFQGEDLDFSDYRALLPIKKQIGYLTSGSALISNRSIRDNLCLSQAYFENDLSSTLESWVMDMCRDFGIDGIIEERPANLGVSDRRSAMVIREFVKKPKIMLIEYPEEFSSGQTLEPLIRSLHQSISEGMAFVFLTDEEEIGRHFKSNTLEIREGTIRGIRTS